MSTFSNPQRFCHTWVWLSFHPQFQLQSADIYHAGEQRAVRWLYWDCCCWLLISLDPCPWCCSWLNSSDPDPRLLKSTWSLSSMHQMPQFLARLILDCAYCVKWSLPEIRKGGKRYSEMATSFQNGFTYCEMDNTTQSTVSCVNHILTQMKWPLLLIMNSWSVAGPHSRSAKWCHVSFYFFIFR